MHEPILRHVSETDIEYFSPSEPGCSMSAPKLLLLGAGGHAHACIDVIESEGSYRIAGLIGVAAEIGRKVLGYTVLGDEGSLPELAGTIRYAVIAVGQIKTPHIRMELFATARRLGFKLPAVASPLAYVSRHARIGAGTMIFHGAVVNAAAVVGENCIINSHALIEHGAIVGDHCHVSTGALLNGEVRVGNGTFIGSGSVLRERVVVGDRCIVGLGCRVRHDVPSEAVFTG